MECVLCRRGDASGGPLGSRDAYRIVCPQCGTYDATGRAYAILGESSYDAETRLKLTWAARRASDLGAPLELGTDNLDEIAGSVVEPRPPSRKLDEVILLLAKRTVAFGEVVFVSAEDWPAVFARSAHEYNALLATLREIGLVKGHESGQILTPSGWERVIRLESERPVSTAAFVAMWFDPSMKSAYDDGFYSALHDLGYDPIRVDREHYLGKIDDFIIASIRKSGLLVADFTGMRTGVFFEAGVGLGLGTPVVWTCREDFVPELSKHFDTRQYNHLAWKDPADLKVRLRTRIEVVGRPRPRA
jgi:hypothetical protein